MERNIWWWNWGWKEKSEVELSFSLSSFSLPFSLSFSLERESAKLCTFCYWREGAGKKKKTVAVVVVGLKGKERRSEKEEKKERNRRNWRERDGKKDLALMISFLFFFFLPSFHVGSEMIPDPDLTYDCRSVERREWKKGNVFEMGWKRKREREKRWKWERKMEWKKSLSQEENSRPAIPINSQVNSLKMFWQ